MSKDRDNVINIRAELARRKATAALDLLADDLLADENICATVIVVTRSNEYAAVYRADEDTSFHTLYEALKVAMRDVAKDAADEEEEYSR